MEMDSFCRFYLAARFGVEAVKYAFMAVFALMISGKIKICLCWSAHRLFFICKPACSRSAAAAGPDEMVPAPWGEVSGIFKDFFCDSWLFPYSDRNGRCNFRASGKEEGAEWIEYG